ncbi:class A beta-lactamase, subclass A2 [Aquimarina sediminis]|uniref:class A beta-lactamase, subclass A2 n=1 Tax=Aquimarina sediminis TaxID=2070536 RepID=UPI000CA05BA2|nr:class A beta-lactamase, subclass A2 [Aquimarina sediminis]
MSKKTLLFVSIFLLTFISSRSQSINTLRQKINQVLEGKSTTVGVAITSSNPNDTISIHGDMHLPMQSVYKFHLALAVLHQIDQGKFNLDEKITIDQKLVDSYSHLWSPLRKKYPNGARISLEELLTYTVSLSDNLGCDVLFKLLGGTEAVQSYINEIGIKDIAIIHTEFKMQAEWDRQYENWTTAKAANKILQLVFENDDLLSPKSYDFIINVLKETKTGKKSIRGLLPAEAIVAHKTGHSGKNKKGLTGALNDIGIIFLPNGTHFYLSVLVSDSMENNETNQKIIAEIAKLAWDYFESK